MQLPKLTPLRLRFAVSLAASFILVVFYLSLSSPHFAYAAETDSTAAKDPSLPRLLDLQDRLESTEQYGWDDDEEVEQSYEPDFAGFDRGIIGRAPVGSQHLENNVPGKLNITLGGDPQYWVFPNETLWGPHILGTSRLPSALEDGTNWGISQNPIKQQNDPKYSRMVYISISVCDQPSSNSNSLNGTFPPPLELYISSSNPEPGPGNYDSEVPVNLGFGDWTLTTTGAIYFAVLAPADSNFNGSYSYELAVSIDAPYASYLNTTFLNFIDSDTNATLLETNITANANTTFDTDLYKQWMSTPHFSVFVLNPSNSAAWGLYRSFCGLKNHAQIIGNASDQQASSVNMSMTNRTGGYPKEQFHIQNLNGSSNYSAIPAIDGKSSGESVVGGGGMVWAPTNFSTKSDGNCRVIFDLPFCSEVAYAVPSNPNKTFADLVAIYNNNAGDLYENFTKSLQQIPCNTTASAQYSLARNCDDCARAYKQWLCAVIIPRCEDFSSPSNHTWFKPRNLAGTFINGTKPSTDINPIFNTSNLATSYMSSSRNLWIDTHVMPGPYKEVLPCEEMCYELVRSCPASLEFACPLAERGLEISYGKPSSDQINNMTCNYVGVPPTSGVVGIGRGRSLVLLTAYAAAIFLAVLV